MTLSLRLAPIVLGALGVLGACTPKGSPPEQQAPRFPPHSAPSVPEGPLGQPGDEIAQLGDQGQWLAVCRGQGSERRPRLILDEHRERTLDRIEASDASGLFVLFTDAGHRRLYDVRTHDAYDLGPISETTRGDIRDGVLAYGRRPPDRGHQIVLRTLATGQERVLASPLPGLHAVQIERSGRGVWLTASDITDDRQIEAIASEDEHYADQHMCETPTRCRGFSQLPRRYKGLVWLDDPDNPVLVELDDNPARPRAFAGAVVHDTSKGVELIYEDRRERIAEPDCHPVAEHHHDEFLLLGCGDRSSTHRYVRWTPEGSTSLDFWGPGVHVAATDTLLSGAWNRWLEADALRMIQGQDHQTWGYAHGDHVMLVGKGVEILDARTNTRVTRLPGTQQGHRVNGPYVALRNEDHAASGGRVVDIRDGHVVRSYAAEALHLAGTGQVLHRDPDGRLRWTP